MVAKASFADGPHGSRLAYLRDGSMEEIGPCGLFWLGGFMSEMTGSKAESLADLARSTRRNALRCDYSGHGQSDGLFIDGSISLWLEQALHMFLQYTKNHRIIVGSSMGGWLASDSGFGFVNGDQDGWGNCQSSQSPSQSSQDSCASSHRGIFPIYLLIIYSYKYPTNQSLHFFL